MLNKIKTLALAALFMFMPTATLAVVGTNSVQAQPTIQSHLCTGADRLELTPDQIEECDDATAEDAACDFNCILERVVNIISVIVGVVAVIMIIFGGFRYIVSGGSAEKVTAAKNTILYGIIGLIIVALAQIIVRFVLRQTTTGTP